jgi:uncharacterized membrane protein YhhN
VNKNSNMFVPGLLCFLLAHIMYILTFFGTPGKNFITGRWYLILPVLIYGVILVKYLYPGLNGMFMPVVIYAVAILTMLISAINRKEKVSSRSYYLVLAGAFLFVISDSLIAVSKFSQPVIAGGIIIMSTYAAAQFLIVLGYISQVKPTESVQISL